MPPEPDVALVERLARWLHETFLEHSPRGQAAMKNQDLVWRWEGLAQDRQEEYRTVAHRLLQSPPAWLRLALVTPKKESPRRDLQAKKRAPRGR
jgi:hypothetical protein